MTHSAGCPRARCPSRRGERPGPATRVTARASRQQATRPPGPPPRPDDDPEGPGDPAVKSAVETLNPTRVKLTVEVPYDELKPSLDAAYKTIASRSPSPASARARCRRGSSTSAFGRGAVLEEAVNDAPAGFYRQAVEASEVRPLGQPEVDVTEVPDPARRGGELQVHRRGRRPPRDRAPGARRRRGHGRRRRRSATRTSTRGCRRLRERFGTLVGVDRAAADGDFVTIDLAATIDDEEIDSVTGVSLRGRLRPTCSRAWTRPCPA